ncbi:MAG: winged helix-turn-helix domain-containing protein [Terriglobia bacterium]
MIGAGVSGLTVAHDLVQVGYKVTVLETDAEPGGMLTVGVPIFRLPREMVKKEINAILALGGDLKCNLRLGRDFTLGDLRRDGYKAIFMGIGLPKGPRSGRPRHLSEAQLREVDGVLWQTPRDLGLTGTLWDRKTLSAWIEQRFQVQLRVRQCQRLFRQRGFRLCKPRPLIAHADLERQKTHKKTSGVKPRPRN